MPLLSILTPTQAHNADHITATWSSISAQRMPSGWELEWLVQEDGASPSVSEQLPVDSRIRYDALGVQVGGPATRNHALARAGGVIVAGLDHDDFYEPGGVAALLDPFLDHTDIGWTSGRVRWQMPDSSTWTKDDVFGAGRVPSGRVADHFLAHDDFPFPAAMAAYRRLTLVAHGGWPAVARSTDAVLLAAFGDVHDGWWVDRDIAVYRRWPAQKTVQPQDWAIRDLPHVRGIIAARRQAIQALAAAQIQQAATGSTPAREDRLVDSTDPVADRS